MRKIRRQQIVGHKKPLGNSIFGKEFRAGCSNNTIVHYEIAILMISAHSCFLGLLIFDDISLLWISFLYFLLTILNTHLLIKKTGH